MTLTIQSLSANAPILPSCAPRTLTHLSLSQISKAENPLGIQEKLMRLRATVFNAQMPTSDLLISNLRYRQTRHLVIIS